MADNTSKSENANDSVAGPEIDRSAKRACNVAERQKEVGGRDGPDPTRYGDWEKNGRCIDF